MFFSGPEISFDTFLAIFSLRHLTLNVDHHDLNLVVGKKKMIIS